jgi:hypothetical protein
MWRKSTMKQPKHVYVQIGALLAFAAAAPGVALAYGDQDAIRDCESRLRSEYKITDLRDATAERLQDTVHHYKVQGLAKVDGDKHPWTCEVKNRHVTSAEYSGPKPKGMGTAEKLAIGAGVAVAAGVAANELSKHQGSTGQATTPHVAAANSYPNRCEFYHGKTRTNAQACSYSQHQGGVNIMLADGTEYSLDPVGDKPGTYVKTGTNTKVYRKSGLGSKGMIYEFPGETLHILY